MPAYSHKCNHAQIYVENIVRPIVETLQVALQQSCHIFSSLALDPVALERHLQHCDLQSSDLKCTEGK